MSVSYLLRASILTVAAVLSSGLSRFDATAQVPWVDAGVRGGSPGAGGPIAGFSDVEALIPTPR
jgi:hypothetical protein